MANPPRARKRVKAVRRAADGSAFEDCHFCGVSVAIALADMHDCEPKKDVKRFKGVPSGKQIGNVQRFEDQPRSPFRMFMESFSKACDTNDFMEVDRKGFFTWKNMSKEERQPYVVQAELVNAACEKALLEEIKDMPQVDDEAVSARVGKCGQFCKDSDSYNSSWYSGSESSDSDDWVSTSDEMLGFA